MSKCDKCKEKVDFFNSVMNACFGPENLCYLCRSAEERVDERNEALDQIREENEIRKRERYFTKK